MNRSTFTALALALLAAAPASAQTPHAPYASSPFVLPETETWDLASPDGQTYRIYISRPQGDPPEGGYPVLYVLDGNAMFAGFAEARRIQSVYSQGLDKMIIVGIGYPGGKPYDSRRMGDFTAPIQTPTLQALYKDYPAGGRDSFAAFLTGTLRTEIARRYPVHPIRQSLFGHSLGGLFALHMLYSRPGAFHAVVAASPSIWWDNQAILGEELAFRTTLEKTPALGRASRIQILVGEREETPVTVNDSIALAKRLEALSAYGLRSSFQILDEETHITVPSRAVTTTLRTVMQWP